MRCSDAATGLESGELFPLGLRKEPPPRAWEAGAAVAGPTTTPLQRLASHLTLQQYSLLYGAFYSGIARRLRSQECDAASSPPRAFAPRRSPSSSSPFCLPRSSLAARNCLLLPPSLDVGCRGRWRCFCCCYCCPTCFAACPRAQHDGLRSPSKPRSLAIGHFWSTSRMELGRPANQASESRPATVVILPRAAARAVKAVAVAATSRCAAR